MNLTAVRRDRRRAIRQQRKRRRKCCAFANAVAVCGNSPAVKLNQMAHDRQAQTKTTKTPGRRTVRLTKTIEYAREKLRSDSLARITDRYRRVRIVLRDADVNLAVVWRELHRVGQEVPDDLLHPRGVGGDRAQSRPGPVVESDSLRVGSRLHDVDCRA